MQRGRRTGVAAKDGGFDFGVPEPDFFILNNRYTMKKLFYFAAAALLLAACSDDNETPDGPTPPPAPVPENFEVISFEPAEGMIAIDGEPVTLGTIEVVGGMAGGTHANCFWAKPYAELFGDPDGVMGLTIDVPLFSDAAGAVWFGSYYCDCSGWGSVMDSWGGFALSQNSDMTSATFDYANQFSVYAPGGANSTKTFAMAYCNGMMGGEYSNPVIDFVPAREVDHLYMAAATMAYTFYTHSTSAPKDRTCGYTVIGSADGEETGRVDVKLVEAGEVVDDWVKVDLSALGRVDRITFEPMGFNPNADMDPAYFCIDEIALVKE